ncbi:MAG: hypothetical protein IJ179_07205 [Oscillospiraceae bacterium]|nr:hypothetical protein [Oscillospiraceae bacterium]
MKKLVFLLLSLLLTMALLVGCGSTPAATPAPETAPPQEAAPVAAGNTEDAAAPVEAAPAEAVAPAETAEPETPAPAEDPAAAFLAEGRYFTLVLPEEWEGQVSVEERDAPYAMTFYHTQSHEAEGGGRLFSLYLYDDTSFVGLPHYEAAGLLSDGETERYLVLDLPTDVQAALEYMDEYFALYDTDQFLRICQNLQPAQGCSFRELDPAVLRAAQARFEYANAMSIVQGMNRMPDGSEVLPEGWSGDMAGNRFAIFDVDGDGQEELLISVEDSYMAGMRTMIYCLGENFQLKEELGIFPSAEYYLGGLVRAYASHNQTHGVLWPYTLYRYDGAQNVYVQIASVYGWDKEYGETDYNGDPFPTAADLDGNGSVASLQDAEGQRWIDDSELSAWEAEQFGGSEQLVIPWQAITRENVNALWDTV